ncbi:MAG: sugar ABC transporter permease [Alphaproteobacteria bacterium]|nr:sugar ABC transporter permease [Alphaproteobacteria bacterium]
MSFPKHLFPKEEHKVRARFGVALVLPLCLVIGVIALWPLIRVFMLSFTDKELFALTSAQFVGWDNFSYIFHDQLFLKSLYNTVLFVLVSVSAETILGVAFACLMHYQHPLRSCMRAMILIPWAIPTIISTKMWEWMLSDSGGVINEFLLWIGVLQQPMVFAAHPQYALWVVACIDVWKTTPFMALLILAGLQIMPQECADAARIDGISPLRFFFKVTLPLLRNTIIIAVVLRLIDAMRVFDVIYGLAGDSSATISLAVYIRQQMFSFQSLGISSAAATVLLIMVSSVIFILLRLRKQF